MNQLIRLLLTPIFALIFIVVVWPVGFVVRNLFDPMTLKKQSRRHSYIKYKAVQNQPNVNEPLSEKAA